MIHFIRMHDGRSGKLCCCLDQIAHEQRSIYFARFEEKNSTGATSRGFAQYNNVV